MFNSSNSRTRTRVSRRGDVDTTIVNQPEDFHIQISSGRYGKEGTEVTLGFDGAENRFLKIDGRKARALFNALGKHYGKFIYND